MPRIFIQLSLIFTALFYLSCDFPRNVKEIERHLSPNNQREVILQRSESSDLKYIELITKTKNKTLQLQTPLYYEKDWDKDIAPDFEKNFQTRQWVNDQIFFVDWTNDFKKSNSGILIQNNSSKVIDQIAIAADGHYIIYELQPNEIVRIPISWEKREPDMRCWVSVTVDYSDGSKILPGSSMFNFINSNNKVTGCGNGKIMIMENEIQFFWFNKY